MIINRELRITLLISFVWHIFWLSFVSLVFLPTGLKPRADCSVNFFGSILSQPLLAGPGFTSGPEHREVLELPAEAKINIQKKGHFYQRQKMLLPMEKETLFADNFINIDAPKEIIPFSTGVFSDGPLPQREVIFKPAYPQYPEWAQQEFSASGNLVMFKIYISAEGMIERIINMRVSGNPEIDVAWAGYVRKWRFAPLINPQIHWQIVKLNTDNKK